MTSNQHIQLLHQLVEEYISSARPVGSSSLQEQLGLSISSATIRHILRGLEQEGYLQQPHTSAGRIPTDKGYRSYVNSLKIHQPKAEQVERLADQLHDWQEKYNGRARAMAQLMSRLASTIAVSGWLPSHEIQEAGLTAVLDQPESEDYATVREVYEILDDIEQYVERFAHDPGVVNVFIGRENTAYSTQFTSILTRTAHTINGESVVLMLIGPKRMPYRRHLALLDNMAAVVENS